MEDFHRMSLNELDQAKLKYKEKKAVLVKLGEAEENDDKSNNINKQINEICNILNKIDMYIDIHNKKK